MSDYLDCGDNLCLFAEQKGGMRTNGGCRCLSDLRLVYTPLRRKIERTFVRVRQERKSLLDTCSIQRDEIDRYKEKCDGLHSDRMDMIKEVNRLRGIIEGLVCNCKLFPRRKPCQICRARLEARGG